MTVHRVDDIVGGQRFAVVELDALADLECPLGGAVIRQDFFRQLRLVAEILGQAGQRAVIHPAAEIVGCRGEQGRVERIVRAMLVTGKDDAAAALRRAGPNIGHTGEQGTGSGGGRAGGHHVVHEVPAGDALLNHV